MKKLYKKMDETHLNNFSCYSKESYGKNIWHGHKTKEWWDSVLDKIECDKDRKDYLSKLCVTNERLRRCCLRAICQDANNSDLLCLVSVMAWGGQRISNAKLLFKNSSFTERVEYIIKRIRSGSLPYCEAYQEFRTAHKKNKIKGIGPAYYTKLIFFCDPKQKGYMVDRWVAKSINLLMHKDGKVNDIVSMTKGTEKNERKDIYVDKNNKKCQYKKACDIINEIADCFGWNGEQVELALFAGKHSEWRRYVKNNYHYEK